MSKKLFLAILALWMLASCNNQVPKAPQIPKNLKTNSSNSSYTPQGAKIDTSQTCNIIQKYNLPVPYDILRPYILGKPFMSQLFSPDSLDRLLTTTSRAFYLGVYTADLAYTSTYSDRQLISKYYFTVSRLSNILGIKTGIWSKYINQLNGDINKDTLRTIINNSITDICRFLDQTNQISILPFMLIGAWDESMYLLTGNILENSDVSPKLYNVLAQQDSTVAHFKKYLNDNMLSVNSFTLSTNLQYLNSLLDSISSAYNSIYMGSGIMIDSASVQKLRNTYLWLRRKMLHK